MGFSICRRVDRQILSSRFLLMPYLMFPMHTTERMPRALCSKSRKCSHTRSDTLELMYGPGRDLNINVETWLHRGTAYFISLPRRRASSLLIGVVISPVYNLNGLTTTPKTIRGVG